MLELNNDYDIIHHHMINKGTDVSIHKLYTSLPQNDVVIAMLLAYNLF